MSIVTEEHVSALRAMLVEDLIEYELLVGRLKDAGRLHGLGTLVAAAFYEAVYRRFGDGYTIAEVIGFVADERTRFSDPEDDFDPRVAERLVCAVLGQGSAGGMDKETEGRAQLALRAGLIGHENLDEAGLDQFLEEARKVADASVERP